MSDTVTRYELPRQRITLLGYVVRRMHKTRLLQPLPELLRQNHTAEALLQLLLYAGGASASFGPAYYQPYFNAVGETVAEADPATGAQIAATLVSDSPHYRITYMVNYPSVGQLEGAEEILGTTVGLRGLGMPAPTRLNFSAPEWEYTAQLTGTITSELALGLFSRTRIRAYGQMLARDSHGNGGTLKLDRSGLCAVTVTAADGRTLKQQTNLGE